MTQGIILAAGMGRRMKGQIGSTPKSMLKVCGKPLIERNIDYMFEAGVERVTVVVGYEKNRFEYLPKHYEGRVELVENPDYEFTNTAVSLWCARDAFCDDAWITMADILLRDNPYLGFPSDRNFYLLRRMAEYKKPDWIANLDSSGRIVSVDMHGTVGHAYNGISHWTREGLRYIRSLMEKKDMSDEKIRLMYWDELLLPHLENFEVNAEIIPSNDYIYEFDDINDIALFEREQGLSVALDDRYDAS